MMVFGVLRRTGATVSSGGGTAEAVAATTKENLPVVACPSAAAVRQATVYRPFRRLEAIGAVTPMASSGVRTIAPNGMALLAESRSWNAVKRSSGRSENQRLKALGEASSRPSTGYPPVIATALLNRTL
jgi:hypothetical protein